MKKILSVLAIFSIFILYVCDKEQVVEEKEQTDNKIIIKTECVDTFRDKFVNWNGITE